jgi:hypothetical protein
MVDGGRDQIPSGEGGVYTSENRSIIDAGSSWERRADGNLEKCTFPSQHEAQPETL